MKKNGKFAKLILPQSSYRRRLTKLTGRGCSIAFVTPPNVVSRVMQLPNVHHILSEQCCPSVSLLLKRHFAMPSHLNISIALL